jgi:hypothetical protein
LAKKNSHLLEENYQIFDFTKLGKKKKKAQGIQNPGPIIEGRANQLFCFFLRVQKQTRAFE